MEVGTSVASALSAETGIEIMKCISDVDMRARVRMGSKCQIFRFFISGCVMAHYYACKFGLNRLRIDGDIREKPL